MPEIAEVMEREVTPEMTDKLAADEAAKKKKKKSKGAKNSAPEAPAGDADKDAKEDKNMLSSQEQLLSVLQQSRKCEESRRTGTQRPHLFWDTQPVPSKDSGDFVSGDSGPIEIKTVNDVNGEPYSLPGAFEWCEVDMDSEKEASEVYTLLSENYVEDDDCRFRFDYSIPFLRWALKPPGYIRSWHLGVRVKATGKLVGFISGIPASIQVRNSTVGMAEVNFLCVHKKLRSKRLAPVLIKEITRKVNLENIWQAVYIAGIVIPTPVSECRYYHRSLNPKKLIDVGFSHLAPRMTMARTIKLYKVPDSPQIAGMRPMEPRDSKRVHELVTGYLKKFVLYQEFTEEELMHCLLPRENVVYSFVREDPSTGVVSDICSFYELSSNVLGHEKHTLVRAAYSYLNVATTMPLRDLMHDALIFANQLNFDVFNAMNVMENDSFLEDLKFGIGDGHVQYYLYNYKCPTIKPSGIGLVLL